MLEKSWIREGSVGVCVFFHGRVGDLKVMSAFASIVPANFAIVCVQAPFPDSDRAAPNPGFSWWLGKIEGESNASKEEQILESISLIEEFLDSIGHKTVIAAGFSQGAAILTAILQKRPNFFRAVALLSGFFLELPIREPAALVSASTRIFLTHGSADTIVPLERGQACRFKLTELGFDVFYHETEAAHKVAASAIRELKSWFLKEVSNPV
jgi:phospholipase/carboxylesterase